MCSHVAEVLSRDVFASELPYASWDHDMPQSVQTTARHMHAPTCGRDGRECMQRTNEYMRYYGSVVETIQGTENIGKDEGGKATKNNGQYRSTFK